jgi:hypothetical protein
MRGKLASAVGQLSRALSVNTMRPTVTLPVSLSTRLLKSLALSLAIFLVMVLGHTSQTSFARFAHSLSGLSNPYCSSASFFSPFGALNCSSRTSSRSIRLSLAATSPTSPTPTVTVTVTETASPDTSPTNLQQQDSANLQRITSSVIGGIILILLLLAMLVGLGLRSR